jgi:hypothetical protein
MANYKIEGKKIIAEIGKLTAKEVKAIQNYLSFGYTLEEKQKVEAAKERILAGQDVFSGVIYDNNGELRCDTGESVSDEVLLKKMTWFVDGVKLYE